jgi:predicted ATPase
LWLILPEPVYRGAVLTTVAVAGYRSLRDVVVGLGPLTVITGANGSGKSNLYRALRLLEACADGSVVGGLAREGGLQSALWAGPEFPGGARRRGMPTEGTIRRGPVSLRLGFAESDGLGYLVDLGVPVLQQSAFARDPEIKREMAWAGPIARPAAVLVDRGGGAVRSRDGRGWRELTRALAAHQSMLGELSDPGQAPELHAIRGIIRGWRFYDSFRTDPDAPARQPQVGTRTPVLSHDGADVAAALATIGEIGDRDALARTIADAFDGARVSITQDGGWFQVGLEQPGVLRRMGAAELSDGTLRYLLLAAALLSPRPPSLLVLNEPETSLHRDLLPALGRLIRAAAARGQVVVVTHSAPLLAELGVRAVPSRSPRPAGAADGDEGGEGGDDGADDDGDDGNDEVDEDDDDPDSWDGRSHDVTAVHLRKLNGETVVHGQTMLSAPSWEWGSR